MAQVELKVDTKKLEKALAAAPGELDHAMVAVANQVGKRYLGYHAARRLRGPPGVRGTRARGGGFLLRGPKAPFRYVIQGNQLANIVLEVAAKSPIAVVHELGKEIVARSGGSMVVPLPQNGKPM